MKYKSLLQEATLLKRHFRFLVEVSQKNRNKKMLYCPNLGPLPGCDTLGSRVWFSSPSRMAKGCLDVWELVEVDNGDLVSICPSYARELTLEGVHHGVVSEFRGYRFLQNQTDVIVPKIDTLLTPAGAQCFVYIEPVLGIDRKVEGSIPHSLRHHTGFIQRLIELRKAGQRAVLFYCVQNTAIRSMRLVDFMDPEYTQVLLQAIKAGVEIIAYRSHITLREIQLESSVPVLWSENITNF